MLYRADIQILRGVAILMVVLFHFGITSFQSGFLGVDVFFVISGFLMASLYKKKALSFYTRRGKRLLPAYYATVIVTILTASFLTVPSDFNQVKEQGYFALIFSSNIGFWQQASYFNKDAFNPLLHLWSLGVEIQFYPFVPLLALIIKRSKALFISCLLVSLVACFFIVTISPKTSFFMMPLRAWEFLFGYWISIQRGTLPIIKGKAKSAIQWTAITVVALIPMLPVDGRALSIVWGHPAIFALLICIATAILLKNGLPASIVHSFLGRALEKLGDYSYSIYLVHFPVIVFANYAAFEGTKLGATSLTSFLIQTSIIVLAAYLSYTFIEKRPYKKPLKLSLLYSASIFAIVTIGTLIQDNRFSNEQRKIFFAWEDRAVYRCGKLFRLIHPASDICSLNANAMGTTPILLVGNSHADSIKTIFAKVAREYNYETFFYVSNTPLMKGSPIQAEKVLADAIKIGADNIFLHYPPPPKGVDIDQLELLTKHAAKENINVTLILPVPVYSYHVPKALYNASQTNFELAQYSYEDYLNHNAIELSTVNKITNLKTIELADVFCSPTCKIKNEEGSLLYFDSSHLTLSGARMIESRLKENFNALRKQ